VKNSKEYWNIRFRTKDWQKKGGNSHSLQHAKQYVPLLDIPKNFGGILCDFGCAEGDAFPVYRSAYPNATLVGVDFSEHAIKEARKKYGSIAEFICGTSDAVPDCDFLISSHTLEHIENDSVILGKLLMICQTCFIIVPYKESPLGSEHLRIYDEHSLSKFHLEQTIICSVGWPVHKMLYRVCFKNIFRLILGLSLKKKSKQILYEINGLQNV